MMCLRSQSEINQNVHLRTYEETPCCDSAERFPPIQDVFSRLINSVPQRQKADNYVSEERDDEG